MKNKKIIVYNPSKASHLFVLLMYYKILNQTYGKAELLKKILPANYYYYIKAKKIKKPEKIDVGLFNHVEIETINRCNNVCSFCPVNKKVDPRPLHTMHDELFKKIIDQLSEINYSGEIAFHSNNEPLLDHELANRIAYAREKCPNAFLFFYTNGTLINAELVKKYKKSGIQKIVINNYNDKTIMNKNIKKMINELKKSDDSDYPLIVVIIRKLNAVLNNRAGNAPNKSVEKFDHYKYFQEAFCSLPFEQLVIRPDGKISLCCNDALGEYTMGDINKTPIMEIWYGDQYKRIREKLITTGRKGLHLCETCDY